MFEYEKLKNNKPKKKKVALMKHFAGNMVPSTGHNSYNSSRRDSVILAPFMFPLGGKVGGNSNDREDSAITEESEESSDNNETFYPLETVLTVVRPKVNFAPPMSGAAGNMMMAKLTGTFQKKMTNTMYSKAFNRVSIVQK